MLFVGTFGGRFVISLLALLFRISFARGWIIVSFAILTWHPVVPLIVGCYVFIVYEHFNKWVPLSFVIVLKDESMKITVDVEQLFWNWFYRLM